MISGCLRCESLVGDLLEDSSDLGGIFSLPRDDEILGIESISLRKLWRMSSWDIFQVRAIFPANSRDSSVKETNIVLEPLRRLWCKVILQSRLRTTNNGQSSTY